MRHQLRLNRRTSTIRCSYGYSTSFDPNNQDASLNEAWSHIKTEVYHPGWWVGPAVVGGLLLVAVLAIFVFGIFDPCRWGQCLAGP